MDRQQEGIVADLRGILEGEIRCDDVFLQLYCSDASLYEIKPLGIVRPRGVADVVATVRYAHEKGIPIHARGAGTGLAGESLGPGIVIDFSHSMRRVLRIDAETVTVQPGVVHAQLNRQLASMGRLFGPDPATAGVTTMGSVLALDGGGSHWLKYGSARAHVQSMTVVLADGQMIEVGRHPVTTGGEELPIRDQLVNRLADLLSREQSTIAEYQPRSLVNRSGYYLRDVVRDNELDLAKLLVGSEGTLALVVQATVRTQQLPRNVGQALLFFDRIESAATAAIDARELGLCACDLMDRRLLSIAAESDARYARAIPRAAEAVLMIETLGDSEYEVRQRIENAVESLRWRKRLAFDSLTTLEPSDIALYRKLTRRMTPLLYRMKGTTRPLPFIEDIAVHPEDLASFLNRLQKIFKAHQVTASLFGHAGHGQLHVRPFLDPGNPDDVRKMQDLAVEVYEQVIAFRGTVSGEHGVGLSRTWFLRRQYGPLYDVFREVKRTFDPKNILNPGKVVAEAPQPLTKNLRPRPVAESPTPSEVLDSPPAEAPVVVEQQTTPLVQLQLTWSPTDVIEVTQSCNGCGRCRTQSAEYRMCPIFRFAPREEASPRAKANLMRGVLSRELPLEALQRDDVKDIADLCVHCYQCKLECPAGVDIPGLMLEAKAQYTAVNGPSSGDWFLARLHNFAAWGSRFRTVANWAIGNPFARWLLEKMFGLAQGRKLPRLAAQPFIRWASRRRLTRDPQGKADRKVAIFVDINANWFDSQVAEALVAVLQHNGIAVFVPTQQRPSGMIRLAQGDAEGARRMAAANIAILSDAVRRGYKIVTPEPSAAVCLREEYPRLFDNDDARLVAANTFEACGFLWNLHKQGQLRLDFRPQKISLGYHEPCHSKVLHEESPAQRLLQLLPGVSVIPVERGCSGMAGAYGLKAKNYRASLRCGFGLIAAMRNPEIQNGVTECSACKMQMEQGTTKSTLHPLKLLAAAYGLMPKMAKSIIVSTGDAGAP